jgi:hypothetical protein
LAQAGGAPYFCNFLYAKALASTGTMPFASCRSGHALKEVKLGMMQGWVHARTCKYCLSSIDRSEMRYHCHTCQIDVCSKCAHHPRQSEPASSLSNDRGRAVNNNRSTTPPRQRPQRSTSAEPPNMYMRAQDGLEHTNLLAASDRRSVSPLHRPRDTTPLGGLFAGSAALRATPFSAQVSSDSASLHQTRSQSPCFGAMADSVMSMRTSSPRSTARAQSPTEARGRSASPMLRWSTSAAVGAMQSASTPSSPRSASRGRSGMPFNDFGEVQAPMQHLHSTVPEPAAAWAFTSHPHTTPRTQGPGQGQPSKFTIPTSRLSVASTASTAASTPRSTLRAASLGRPSCSKRVSFASQAEWIFFDDEETLQHKVANIHVPLRPDGQIKRSNPCQVCATWCPCGSACGVHGGVVWPNENVPPLASPRMRGSCCCPFEKPSPEFRRNPFPIGQPDEDTCIGTNGMLAGIPPPMMAPGAVLHNGSTPLPMLQATWRQAHCQQPGPIPVFHVFPNYQDSRMLLHVM